MATDEKENYKWGTGECSDEDHGLVSAALSAIDKNNKKDEPPFLFVCAKNPNETEALFVISFIVSIKSFDSVMKTVLPALDSLLPRLFKELREQRKRYHH